MTFVTTDHSTRIAKTARISSRVHQPGSPDEARSPRDLVLMTAWFGLMTSLLELGHLLLRNKFNGGVALGTLQMNRLFAWMIPAADLLIFLVAGLGLLLLGRVRPRAATRFAPALLGFLSALAILLSIPGLYAGACLPLAGGVAAMIGRRVARRPDRARRVIRATLPFVFLALAALTGWGTVQAMLTERLAQVSLPPPNRRSPNVLLLVMDTVRAESLSLHGYHRDTSPNLARIARRGIRFEQARSTAPWTLTSHASLFTGRYPHDVSADVERPLDDTHPTLAEYLSGRGYATGGFVANMFYCNAWYGLGRGFARYEDFYDKDVSISLVETFNCSSIGHKVIQLTGISLGESRRRKDAARVNRDFLDWADSSIQQGRPFFAFLNYFDAHTPYIVPEGFHRHFGVHAENADDVAQLHGWNDRPKRSIPDRLARLVQDAYDDCIASMDEQIGKLFDELERRGVLENTLVIITSDHGEHMGEHGQYGHGRSLYGQEVHVPLIVIPPGGLAEGRNIPEPVSLRDVPATVVDMIGLANGSPFPGASLAGFGKPDSSGVRVAVSPVLSEASLRTRISNNPQRPPAWRGPMKSLVIEGKSYIRNADGREELYDLADDPGETRDLSSNPEATAILEHARAVIAGQ